MKRLKHIVFDVLGVTLILLSPTLGWLPGPGGIPLLLAGLGFLSVHHDWAKKLITYIKKNGIKIGEQIFREHPALQAIYDLVSFGLFAGGIYLITVYTRSLTLSIAIVCIFTALTIFLGNRKRLERLNKVLKKKLNR